MANASIDSNSVATITAALNTDGATVTRVKANSSTHGLNISDAATGSDNGPGSFTLHDDNGRPALMAVSSADGATPVVLYADSNGSLLIQST